MAIVADTLPQFPTCPAYGFTVDPHFDVKIVAREGGHELVNRRWAHPLRRFSGVPIGDKPERDIESILFFWLALGGASNPFRFRDYTDYTSSRLRTAPTAIDQPLVSAGGGAYHLYKQYIAGPYTYERRIYRPRGSTLLIANEVGAVQASSTWSINEATGVLTTLGGFTGTPTTWGGEFDIKVRFDGPFVPEISNFKIQRADVTLIEKREEV